MNPSTAGRSRRDARRRLNDEVLRLPAVGNSDAHVLEGIGTGVDLVPRLERGRLPDGDRGSHDATRRHVLVAPPQRRCLSEAARAKLRHLGHTLRPSGEWR